MKILTIEIIAIVALILLSAFLGFTAGTYNYKYMENMVCTFDIKPLHEIELE